MNSSAWDKFRKQQATEREQLQRLLSGIHGLLARGRPTAPTESLNFSKGNVYLLIRKYFKSPVLRFQPRHLQSCVSYLCVFNTDIDMKIHKF
jgi:hypothetical protein